MDNKNRIMKAPDKLYVSQLIYETWQYQTPDPDDETQVEYIRKNALLEWLESKVYEHNEDRFDDGFNNALGQVIDKLNSM